MPSLASMWWPELDDLSLLEGRELSPCSCILPPLRGRRDSWLVEISVYLSDLPLSPLCSNLFLRGQLLACLRIFSLLRRHKAQDNITDSAPAKSQEHHTTPHWFSFQSLRGVTTAEQGIEKQLPDAGWGLLQDAASNDSIYCPESSMGWGFSGAIAATQPVEIARPPTPRRGRSVDHAPGGAIQRRGASLRGDALALRLCLPH